MPSVVGLLEERELAARQRMESLREEADRIQAALSEAELDWERWVIARRGSIGPGRACGHETKVTGLSRGTGSNPLRAGEVGLGLLVFCGKFERVALRRAYRWLGRHWLAQSGARVNPRLLVQASDRRRRESQPRPELQPHNDEGPDR
ncbi:hypothetical protein GCM10010519_15110 [Streptomyces lactacystinicus]